MTAAPMRLKAGREEMMAQEDGGMEEMGTRALKKQRSAEYLELTPGQVLPAPWGQLKLEGPMKILAVREDELGEPSLQGRRHNPDGTTSRRACCAGAKGMGQASIGACERGCSRCR